MTYKEIIARRRALKIDGYETLADVGLDGEYVTPIQIISHSETGPVLVGHHWLDAPSAKELRDEILAHQGYLPELDFNKVLNIALDCLNMKRSDIYVTQAFHLLPKSRCGGVRVADARLSFRQVTIYELEKRQVVALGTPAANLCQESGIKHVGVVHPSAPGLSYDYKAKCLVDAINKALGHPVTTSAE